MTDMDTTATPLRGLIARGRPERDLLAAGLQGDAVAFSEIYRRFSPAIHGFCLARLRDAEAAADATQEVFLRALRSEASDVENPSAWLFTIARNVVVDTVRAAGRRPLASEFDEDAVTVGGLVPAGAHDQVETDEDVSRVMLALRALAPRYRTAIVMRDIKGLTSAEAAGELRTTTGALDTLLHRARRALAAEHARIDKLPASCRRARALLYEPDRVAMSDRERQALDIHLLGCEQCRAERSRMKRRHMLQALLPFLFPTEHGSDAISRGALAMAHPMSRVAAIGVAVALTAVPSGLVAVRMRVPETVPAPVAGRATPATPGTLMTKLTAPATGALTKRIADACAPTSETASGHPDAHPTSGGSHSSAGDHAGSTTTSGSHPVGTYAAGTDGTASHSTSSPHLSEPGMTSGQGPGSELVHR